MGKEKKTKSSFKDLLLSFLIGGIIGGIIAGIAIYHTKNEGNLQGTLFYLAIAFFFLAISFFFQIIIHEAGHGLLGYGSGFQFISFRIGSFIWIRENGKIKLRRFNIAGTGGQCLMMPPDTDLFHCPYKWYNIGGILLNCLVTLFFIFVLISGLLTGYGKLFAAMMIVSGIFILITNGIPMKISGITNDAYNMKLLSKELLSRYAFGLQLKVYGLQMQGKQLKEMPEEWFILPVQPDFTNIFHISLFLLKAMRYTEQFDFASARALLLKIEPYENKLVALYRNEWKCELLFCEITEGGSLDRIEKLYTPQLEKYCFVSSKYMLNKKRMLYTYALLVEKNEEKAEKIKRDFLLLSKRYPNQGEATAETEIIERIKLKTSLRVAIDGNIKKE